MVPSLAKVVCLQSRDLKVSSYLATKNVIPGTEKPSIMTAAVISVLPLIIFNNEGLLANVIGTKCGHFTG